MLRSAALRADGRGSRRGHSVGFLGGSTGSQAFSASGEIPQAHGIPLAKSLAMTGTLWALVAHRGRSLPLAAQAARRMGGEAAGSGPGLNGDVARRWRHGRIRSDPARGGRRQLWHGKRDGSRKSITPHALKVRAAVTLRPIEPDQQKDRHSPTAIIASTHWLSTGSPVRRDRQKSVRITRWIHLPLPPRMVRGAKPLQTASRVVPQMLIDLASVYLSFGFGLCRLCPEHVRRSVPAAPALCLSSCGSLLRTMAELCTAS